MLSQHIKNVMPNVPIWRKWIQNHSSAIGIGVLICLLLSSAITLMKVSDMFWTASRDTLSKTVEAKAEIAQKIGLITQYISSGSGERFSSRANVFILAAFGLAIFIAVWVSTAAEYSRPAFLCLTRKSDEAKQVAIKKTQHRFLSFILSLIVAIICGVVGNYLFALYIHKWPIY